MKRSKPTKTVKSFKEEYAQKSRIKTINECSWFCIVWGMILSVAGTYRAVCTQGAANFIYMIIAFSGILLLVVGVAAPLKLQKGIGFIRSAASVVGNVILKVLLLLIYPAMTVINAFNRKKYAAKFGFRNWEERHQADTAFRDLPDIGQNHYKNAVLHTVVDVLSIFIANKMYIVIPIIILLLIIGAVMFFVSSSAVFSFVYTLF